MYRTVFSSPTLLSSKNWASLSPFLWMPPPFSLWFSQSSNNLFWLSWPLTLLFFSDWALFCQQWTGQWAMGRGMKFVTVLGLPANHREGKNGEPDCASCPTLIKYSLLNCWSICLTCWEKTHTHLRSKRECCQQFSHAAFACTSVL